MSNRFVPTFLLAFILTFLVPGTVYVATMHPSTSTSEASPGVNKVSYSYSYQSSASDFERFIPVTGIQNLSV